MTIGIPKALLYYEYRILWSNFFKNIGCNIIYSPNSNKEIESLGSINSNDEACLSLKLYMGHVKYLIDKCDYILVPRIVSLEKKEKTCTNFYALYDLVKNTYKDIKILDYNIDINKHQSEEKAFINIGKKLGISKKETYKAYILAKKKEIKYIKSNIEKQNKVFNTNKKKILIIGNSYSVYDKLIGYPIIKFIKDNNMEVIYGNIYDEKNLDKEYINVSKDIYWTYNKKLLGALWHYLNKVDGIILVSSFPCGPNSLINDLIIRKIKNKPLINLIIDNLDITTGLLTRLESFIDIINQKEVLYE